MRTRKLKWAGGVLVSAIAALLLTIGAQNAAADEKDQVR